MYLVNIKISHKEGSKPVNEQYIVKAIGLTDIDVILAKEFKYYSVNSCKTANYLKVFETKEGNFFEIKLIVEDIDGKVVRELFLQEAVDNDDARARFRENIDYGVILDVVSRPYIGVIK
jgi:hypothetical protein